MMSPAPFDVTTSGIHFSVQPTFRFGSRREMSRSSCFISNQTLDQLATRHYCRSNLPEEIFRQFESEITGVAKRLALAGVLEKPLVVRYGNFTATGG